jgi:peptidoglycan/LPS O-acetylase OafA/YrhL
MNTSAVIVDAPARMRLTQLDGLRGLAAAVVVIHHLFLTVPTLAMAYKDRSVSFDVVEAWLVFSPLHLAWNGNAAVYVFFVLSGFVLVLPFVDGRATPRWVAYYGKRMLRLYLPVWASLALAVLLILTVPRVASTDQSWWVNNHAFPLTIDEVAHDSLLLAGTGLINGPLWSLRWEVLFSLLLPLYVLGAMRWRRWWWGKIPALLVITAVGAFAKQEWLFYLPMFGIGAVLGAERMRLLGLVRRIQPISWAGLTVLALLLLNADWLRAESVPGAGVLVSGGASLLVLVFIAWEGAAALGDSRIAQWLGRISFSLYLTHVPVVVSVTLLLGSTAPWLTMITALAASLLVGELFYRLVEGRAHTLASAVGKKLHGGLSPAAVK